MVFIPPRPAIPGIFVDMNNKALSNSEVFQEYYRLQNNQKQANELNQKEIEKNAEHEKEQYLQKFAELEEEIRQSPKKLAAFKTLQKKIMQDEQYTKKVDPAFVQAVMSLNLDY